MWRAIGFVMIGIDVFLAGMSIPIIIEAQRPIEGVAQVTGANFNPEARIDSTRVSYVIGSTS